MRRVAPLLSSESLCYLGPWATLLVPRASPFGSASCSPLLMEQHQISGPCVFILILKSIQGGNKPTPRPVPSSTRPTPPKLNPSWPNQILAFTSICTWREKRNKEETVLVVSKVEETKQKPRCRVKILAFLYPCIFNVKKTRNKLCFPITKDEYWHWCLPALHKLDGPVWFDLQVDRRELPGKGRGGGRTCEFNFSPGKHWS